MVLQSLIHRGAEITLPRLRGMFAFALYDTRERTLLLARDRFGIKPLSIYYDGEVFLFTSEIKALTPWVELRPNPFPMASYLLGFGGPMKNGCFYQGVRILPPGSVVRLRVGETPCFDRFATITDHALPERTEELARMNPTKAVDRVDQLLQSAVDRMMFADARVGALCSGGVDSSIVMAMATRKHQDLAIFHANVLGPQSEFEAAKALAKHLRLDLKAVEIHDQDFIDLIPEVTYHNEHPFRYHPNSVPFILVSKLVRENGVKGVLSGEGADECSSVTTGWPGSPSSGPINGKIVRHAPGGAPHPQARRQAVALRGQHSGAREGDALRVRARGRGAGELAAYERILGRRSDRNVRTADLLGYHLRMLLHRNDCLGMAASIEARFPFLDEELVTLAVNLRIGRRSGSRPRTWGWAHHSCATSGCCARSPTVTSRRSSASARSWAST